MVCFEAFIAICNIIGMNIQDCHDILHSQLAWINLYVDKGTNIYKQVHNRPRVVPVYMKSE